jgi:ABC-type antimicrobial peptide transport system permease subunit
MTQDFLPRMTVTFSARDTGEATLKLLRRRLDAVAGGLPEKTVVTTLEAHLTKTALAPERIAVVLVSASAATALTLGVLGLYGAILDTTRLRRREFAMRAALGASAPRVIRLVVAEGVRLALAGTIAGMLASLLVARWLVRIAPVGGPVTTAVWLSAPLVLLGAVAVASALPARHALRVNLLTIMREE